MKTFSKNTVYGLRALIYIASNPPAPGGYVGIRQVAEQLDISFFFLTKVLQELTQRGLLTSYRGPQGGVALARDAHRITLLDIVHAIEGQTFFDQCLLGLPGCGEQTPCPMHDYWRVVKADMQQKFAGTTLQQLAERTVREGLRLRGGPDFLA